MDRLGETWYKTTPNGQSCRHSSPLLFLFSLLNYIDRNNENHVALYKQRQGPQVVIIGAGLGGISLGLELDRLGLTNWSMWDREAGVGGTWYQNRYPGCRCDVHAIVYSHSRYPNPNWTQTHPPRSEILDYWVGIAEKEGLMDRINLQHNFVKADWDSARALYTITFHDLVNDKEVIVEANVLVSATGGLSNPKPIEIPGVEDFQGMAFHSARWPHDLKPKDLHGKTVVVVGNGCSGTQIVGALGQNPKINIVSLARSKQWFVPEPLGASRHSVSYSMARKIIWRTFPLLQWLERMTLATVMDSNWYWYLEKNGKRTRKTMEDTLRAWYKAEVPEYGDDLLPDYPFGGKRIVFEDGYFDALNNDNVSSVTGRIASFNANSITLDDGSEIEADVVVLSTGFDAEDPGFEVNGTSDSTANYKSKAEFTMYRGLALPGMPNFFSILGNNTGVNHMSITAILEIQTGNIAQLINGMHKYGIRMLEVKKDAAEKYDSWVLERLQKTTWANVKNYWRGNGGTGRIFTHYPGSVRRFFYENRAPVWADYRGGEPIAARQRIRRFLLFITFAAAIFYGLNHTQRGQTYTSIATAAYRLGKERVLSLIGY